MYVRNNFSSLHVLRSLLLKKNEGRKEEENILKTNRKIYILLASLLKCSLCKRQRLDNSRRNKFIFIFYKLRKFISNYVIFVNTIFWKNVPQIKGG